MREREASNHHHMQRSLEVEKAITHQEVTPHINWGLHATPDPPAAQDRGDSQQCSNILDTTPRGAGREVRHVWQPRSLPPQPRRNLTDSEREKERERERERELHNTF